MQIQEYIGKAKLAGQTEEQIISSLTASGWKIEQIQPYLSGVIPTTVATPDQYFQKRKKHVSFILVAFVLLIIIGSITAYSLLINNNSLTDQKYGFKFTDIQGWKKIPSRNNAYLSLATLQNNNFIFSYLDLRIQPNKTPEKFFDRMINEDNTSAFSTLCKDTDKDVGFTYFGIEKIKIPGTNSYKCTSEGVGTNTNGNILVMENYFIIKPKYNLLITTTYQKNLPQEAENVKRLMDRLQIISNIN